MKGKLEDVITYLEMTSRPPRPKLPTPAGTLALMRAERCTVSFYRYLYNTVGEPWVWFERRKWSDER
ncbi:MAG: family N-acetyltransferase, partial [Rhodospirillales bacterium]|nr:family N-acetyltransferase [Rhodospirillales bacterium]